MRQDDTIIQRLRNLEQRMDRTQVIERALPSPINTSIYADVSRATLQSIPKNVTTAISFSTQIEDTSNFWVIGSPTRFTIPITGRYLISGNVAWAPNNTGTRRLGIRVNGTTLICNEEVLGSNNEQDMSIATQWFLPATAYVELVVLTSSNPATLDVLFVAGYSPHFRITGLP